MRVGGGAVLIVLGGLALFVVAEGYTRNLNSAWNALRGAKSSGASPTTASVPSVNATLGTLITAPLNPLSGISLLGGLP